MKRYINGHTGVGIDRVGTAKDGTTLRWRWQERGSLSQVETRTKVREPC